MYGDFVTGLRDGLEASVVIGLVAAYLVGSGRRGAAKPVAAGAGAALALSLTVGHLLEFGSRELTPEAGRLLTGTLSVLTAALVTSMVFRVRRGTGPGAATWAAVGFLAVARDGVDAAVFVWATVRAAGDDVAGSPAPLAVVLLGIATAVLLGWAAYRAAARIPSPDRSVGWTGGLLVVGAAGVLAYGVRALQDAGPFGGSVPGGPGPGGWGPAGTAFDVSGALPADSWYGALAAGLIGFRPDPSPLQVTVWLLYLVPALALFLAPVGFGRSSGSVRVGVEEQKATDEKAGSGARGGDGAGTDGERLCDGARRAGGRTDGDTG
ncbi:FTR1 family protein [Streptomyces sp. NPDC047928]|uniref:FTR1 family iron permease n=1 Tax=unclassified Streptomyces TaxID=2593676 RepID=UPI003724080E